MKMLALIVGVLAVANFADAQQSYKVSFAKNVESLVISGSLATDATKLPGEIVDIDGQARPKDQVNIGANQVNSLIGAIVSEPLTPADTGVRFLHPETDQRGTVDFDPTIVSQLKE